MNTNAYYPWPDGTACRVLPDAPKPLTHTKLMAHLPAVLADEFAISRSEARRCIAQGGVKVDGEPSQEMDIEARGQTVTLGTRRQTTLRD